MSTEIELHQPGGEAAERDVVDGWLTMASDVIKLANVIAPTEFVPQEYRDNPPAVAAAILAGRELGIGPMTSLRHVQIVKGSPSLSAEYKRARVLAAGHEFDILELNTQRCRVSGRRRGSNKPPLEVTFTMEDARAAGLVKDKGAWKTRPRRMLFARAGSELCDFLFSDVVNGLPTAEVIADGSDEDGFDGYGEPPAKPPARTARRRTAERKPHVDKGEQGINMPPAEDEAPLPPLPGEDEPQEPAPSEPRPVSPEQLTKLGALFTGLGFTQHDRTERIGTAAKIVGRQIGSSKELTLDEASALIDTLERCEGSRERLIALLAAGDAPGGQASDG